MGRGTRTDRPQVRTVLFVCVFVFRVFAVLFACLLVLTFILFVCFFAESFTNCVPALYTKSLATITVTMKGL